MESSLKRDALFRRALATSDVTATYLSLLVALVLGGNAVRPRATDLLLTALVVVLSKVIGLYDRDQHRLRKATIDELPAILNLAVFYALALWLGESLLFSGSLDRQQVFVLVLASFVFVAIGRIITRTVALRITSPERCLVVGSTYNCDRAVRLLNDGHSTGTHAIVVCRIAVGGQTESARDASEDLREMRGAITDAIITDSIERVIFAPDGCDEEEVLDLIRLIAALGVKLSVLPRLLEVVGSASAFDELDGLSLLGVRPYGLSKSSEALKRTLDVIAALVLVLVLSPVLLAIAVAIKLDAPGPVFFTQRRIGRRGKLFDMVKFRSMVPDAEQIKETLRRHNEATGGLFKIRDDPRITRIGRLLRKTSLDELPQLLNVFKGDMSLVGPRPLVPDEDALIEGWRRRRLAVKPGMTGLWQIFGSSRIPMHEMVKLDYMYGANWSLWLDLKILLRTVRYMLSRRGI